MEDATNQNHKNELDLNELKLELGDIVYQLVLYENEVERLSQRKSILLQEIHNLSSQTDRE